MADLGGDLERGDNEAVPTRGRGPDITDIIYNIQYPLRTYYSNYIPGSLRSILTYNREVKKTASADPKTIGV